MRKCLTVFGEYLVVGLDNNRDDHARIKFIVFALEM
jgi:hypothetical protein